MSILCSHAGCRTADRRLYLLYHLCRAVHRWPPLLFYAAPVQLFQCLFVFTLANNLFFYSCFLRLYPRTEVLLSSRGDGLLPPPLPPYLLPVIDTETMLVLTQKREKMSPLNHMLLIEEIAPTSLPRIRPFRVPPHRPYRSRTLRRRRRQPRLGSRDHSFAQ